MPDVGVSVHSVAFITSIAAFVVGIIHLWLSFEGTDSNLKWAKRNEGNHGFISEVNQGWQEAFELTPQAIVDHFQPVLIGWFSLAHHIRYAARTRPPHARPGTAHGACSRALSHGTALQVREQAEPVRKLAADVPLVRLRRALWLLWLRGQPGHHRRRARARHGGRRRRHGLC